MTWAELLHKLVLLQRTTRLCVARCVRACAAGGVGPEEQGLERGLAPRTYMLLVMV